MVWLSEFFDVEEDKEIAKFSADSRDISKNDFFFALKGQAYDACDFLEEVSKKGALAAMVPDTYKGKNFGLKLFYTPNVLQSMQDMAKKFLAKKDGLKIIAITGSVGKTTTKEFIVTLLSQKLRVAKTMGNRNAQASFPLEVLNMSKDAEVFVAEMGMSEIGEIKKLIDIASPDIALVTKIGISHAEFFENINKIAEAKAEIFTSPKTKVKIASSQAATFEAIKKENCFLFDVGEGIGDFKIISVGENLFSICEGDEKSTFFELPFSATHLKDNFLAAFVVARKMNLSFDEIIPQFNKLKPYERRFEVIHRNGVIYINDSYNASPDSVKAALSNLPKPNGGKRIAILGGMRELGVYTEKAHAEVANFALKYIDCLLCFGDETKTMFDIFKKEGIKTHFFEDFEKLKEYSLSEIKSGDVVLIKGSKFYKMWRLLIQNQDC